MSELLADSHHPIGGYAFRVVEGYLTSKQGIKTAETPTYPLRQNETQYTIVFILLKDACCTLELPGKGRTHACMPMRIIYRAAE